MVQPNLLHWFSYTQRVPAPILSPEDGVVLALYDSTLTALEPWAKAGFRCESLGLAHRSKTMPNVRTRKVDLQKSGMLEKVQSKYAGKVALALAFPPSTDVSIAGARWFARKRRADPEFQARAVAHLKAIEKLFKALGCPYAIEGPGTGLRKLWRNADYIYNPCEYGAYLNAEEAHPLYPDVIPAQDAYTRSTGLWTGGKFRMPARRPVPPKWSYFTSKKGKVRRMSPVSFKRTERGARASCPRGWARALCVRMCF